MSSDDTKIELILKQYKPLGLPTELRERIFQSKGKPWDRAWLAIAASMLLVAGIGIIWQMLLTPNDSEMNKSKLAQIERAVVRTGEATQLLAVADFFADQPEGKNHAREIYHEIAHSFPDLNAGIQAQIRLKSYYKGAIDHEYF